MFLQRIYLGMGNSVNFADSAVKNKMKLGIISYLSYMYDEVELSDDFFNYSNKSILSGEFKYTETLGGEECHRWLGGYSDYMWVKKYGKYLKCQADCKEHMFENNMWYIKRWKDKTGFYIKGGNNNESHNHNDVGSFGYIVRGEEMLCDLGAGEYTRDYFGKNRYEILCNSSEGHNVPIVDGKYQLTGDTARAESFYLKADSLIITYGAAYGLRPECVKRKIIFKGEDGFTICDSYCNVKRITESFITKLVPVINGNTVMLKGDSGGISMDFKGHMGLYVREKIHNDHDGNKVRVYIIKADYINNETAYVIEINIKRL